ncbi:hypothetical protein [Trujillonella endophytica]|uniref:Lipoprotein n=1 Tax=Trujillonella endophytica TaxID=673521 RepID=A0A1H8SZ64_9ACTN|nr:hypothetical protein [Trujillella endophytica]SEO83922.1 hypothetical protein SAMN05660991_01939 [Trujillella endophytica]
MSVSQRGRRPLPTGRAAVLAGVLLAGCATGDDGGDAAGASSTPSSAATTAAADWLETTYTLTCDGLVPGGLRATVQGGVARVPADATRPPYYEHYDVRVAGTADGDLDGDAAPDTVVLLECSPQPSNGVVQEVHAYAHTGRPLGALPSPRTLRDPGELPPVYDAEGLAITDGELVAAMSAYGPEDTHAGGPTVPLTVRWRLDDGHFVRVAPS